MSRRLLRNPRVLAVAAGALVLVLGGTPPAAAHDAANRAGTRDPSAGTRDPVAGTPRLRGLRAALDGPCAGGYRLTGTRFCTHGPDARPAGRRLTLQPRSIAAVLEAPLPEAVLCDGDGTSGRRVQAVYARVQGSTSRRNTVIPQIRTAAAGVQATFLASAAHTDGVRRPRWVTDASCDLSVVEVVLSEAARTSFNATITELVAKGLDRSDRKYLVWWDTAVYCGIATFWGDDRPGQDNPSNARTGYARVDAGCWGWAESHELMHTLGAVQNSAPHTTFGVAPGAFGHCTDEYDVMCYVDAPGVTMTISCPDRSLDGLFDCGDDDYFDTHPEPGSYLASHWNAADNAWLERSVALVATPAPVLATGGSVTATRVPVRAAIATRAPLAGLEALEAQRQVGDVGWRDVEAGSGLTIEAALLLATPTTYRARTVDAAGVPSSWRTGPTATARLRDDTSGRLHWSRGWSLVADADALAGSLRRAGRAGRTVSFRTDASQIGIIAARGPKTGRLRVLVDGVTHHVVDLHASSASARTIVATITLTPGRHTIELRVKAPRSTTPGWRVDLDGIALLASRPSEG